MGKGFHISILHPDLFGPAMNNPDIRIVHLFQLCQVKDILNKISQLNHSILLSPLPMGERIKVRGVLFFLNSFELFRKLLQYCSISHYR